MTQGIHPLAASMVNQLNRVDTIANNLANQNTVGFKEDNLVEGSFNSYLQRKIDKKEPLDKLSVVMDTVPKIDGNFIDDKVGSIVPTGNKLDFAITSSNKYFKVMNNKGEIFLTRNGEFKSLNNQLVTSDGYKVLNQNNEPISLEEDSANIIDTLGLVSIEFKYLNKIGDNNYKINDKSQLKNIDAKEFVVKEAIEKSTVNPIKSMVDLIEAQRKFEQSQKAISGIDELNRKVISDLSVR